ncbi:hypothetical protein, conserved [Plasmodium ovale wallikeri]|uniref:Uncharacterized protein n=1 Tax=Plasmodium ovale wallikeri TaxID=864142 RepID=A0A1A8YMN2_PLAOA|nr:hypothetical protein, conserved [Plasmodium ovale wallikeri]
MHERLIPLNAIYVHDGNRCIVPPSVGSDQCVKYLFLRSSGIEKKPRCCSRKSLFSKGKGDSPPFQKEIALEKVASNSGNDFLCGKLFINDKARRFIVDLCSDNSFIFQKEHLGGRDETGEGSENGEGSEVGEGSRGINSGGQMRGDHSACEGGDGTHLCMWYSGEDVRSVKEEIHLNNKRIKVDTVIHVKREKENEESGIPFYVMKNEELSKNYDGIIGFNFFRQFSNFTLDTVNMNIIMRGNGEHTVNSTINNAEVLYELKLYDFFNCVKHFNIRVDNHIHKGILDTATSKTVIVNSDSVTNNSGMRVDVENVLGEKFNVEKIRVGNISLISKDNNLISSELSDVYKGELEYLCPNVVLLGLDFLLYKKFTFDLKRETLYIVKGSLEGIVPKTGKNISQEGQFNIGEDIHIDDLKVEEKCKEIFEKLRKKEISFMKITSELEGENISISDCKSTNDVIRVYAIKIIYGSDFLKKKEQSSETNNEFKNRYKEIIDFFKKLKNEEKQDMLRRIVHIMKDNGLGQEKKASEILEKFVTYEIHNNVYSLHRFKSSNVNKRNDKAVMDEFNQLLNFFNAHPEYSFEMLNDFKKELSQKRIDYNDCKDEQSIIKRIAQARVYNDSHTINNSGGKDGKNKRRKNIIVRRYSNDGNNIHTQIIIRRNGFGPTNDSSNDGEHGDHGEHGEDEEDEEDEEDGNGKNRGYTSSYENISNNIDDLFPNSILSGIFKNFFGDNRNEGNQEEGQDEDTQQNDLLSELNNMFGFGNMGNNFFRKKKKSVIGFKTKEPNVKNESTKEEKDNLHEAIKQEKDVDIIYLLKKVQKLNDMNLKNFILQSLKNENIRKILIDALKKGYQNTYEQCKQQNDNKGMYLLQMLKQSGIF